MQLGKLFMFEPLKNFPGLLDIRLTWIPILWVNMMNTCRSQANQRELFVFLTIYESKSNNYSQIRWIKICLVNSKMAEYHLIFAQMLFNICFDIPFEVEYFDLEPSYFASPTIRLKLQRFAICFDNESWSLTLLCRYLMVKFPIMILPYSAHIIQGL